MTQKAKIAYLVSPQRGVYVLMFQPEGSDELKGLEISKGHLANIVITGTDFAFREDNRISMEEPRG
jgi:hypothetical protein